MLEYVFIYKILPDYTLGIHAKSPDTLNTVLAQINVILRANCYLHTYVNFWRASSLVYLPHFIQTQKASESLKKNSRPNNNDNKRLQNKHVRYEHWTHPGITLASLLPGLQWTTKDPGARIPSSDQLPGQWPQWKTMSRKHNLNACLSRKVETSKPPTAEWNKYRTRAGYSWEKGCQVPDFNSSVWGRSGTLGEAGLNLKVLVLNIFDGYFLFIDPSGSVTL